MPKNDSEVRFVAHPLEHRESETGVTIGGYAAVFGQETDIAGYFTEEVAEGAFTETLRSGDALAYFGHDRNRVLGRVSSGTLRLNEDEVGLAAEIDLPDTTDGRDALSLISRGDIKGMSFGFHVTREEWDEAGDMPKRTIMAADLFEVSIVSEPAYEGTSVALRSLEDVRKDQRRANFQAAQLRRAMKLGVDLRDMNSRT